MKKNLVSIAITAFSCIISGLDAVPSFGSVINSVAELPSDENDRLQNNYLVYLDNPVCESQVMRGSLDFRERVAMTVDLARQFFPETGSADVGPCVAVCLEKGVPSQYLTSPLLKHKYGIGSQSYSSWVHQNCQKVEVGFISYASNILDLNWIDGDGKRKKTGTVKQGEKNTVWQTSYLGHEFVLVDSVTQEDMFSLTVTHNSVYNIGEMATSVTERDVKSQVKQTFHMEWNRAHRVTRTFTEFGFDKGRLPDDLWASISAYYYNNRQNSVREEWGGKGLYVNWWERDVYFVPMPWELKKLWQTRLMELVSQWSGVELELTDIYGMRRYEDGARLLTHVDREQTHAASLIINVAQGGMRKPWNLEIYDFADRLHEVEMVPGDIVYYESARCLHGRMQPLHGEYYVNLFAHYRPKGDSGWFTKPNPADTPQQVLDIGTCSANSTARAATCTGGHHTPYLSPSLAQLKGPADLFKFWEDTQLDRAFSNDEL